MTATAFCFLTLACLPPSAQRALAGAGDDVVSLSVGLEDAADIIGDLEQALAAA